jgi:hypothetical protein
MAQAEAGSRPKVILLSLQSQLEWQEVFETLLNKVKAKADIEEVTSATEATALLTGNRRPSVVIATDGALTRRKFSKQQTEAIQYVQDGGTLIFGLGFPSFTKPSEYKDLFKALSLPWEAGEYFRSVFDLNGAAEQIGTVSLPPRYSQKALHLKNVEKKHAVYLPSASSHIQSAVFPPDPIADLTQTPTAFRQYGSGKLGYLGDVNMEEETHQVVLAMCGLIG